MILLSSCSIFIEERLERLTKDICVLDLESFEGNGKEESYNVNRESAEHVCAQDIVDTTCESCQSSVKVPAPEGIADNSSHTEQHVLEDCTQFLDKGSSDNVVSVDSETEIVSAKEEPCARHEECDIDVDDFASNKQEEERRLPNAVLPRLRYYQYESSESSSR